MSAKVFSRDYALGKVKKLQRMKQPLAINLTLDSPPGRPKGNRATLGGQRPTRSGEAWGLNRPPRNPVVFAMAHRAASSGAGKHIRAQGAMRRAEKVTLQKLVRQLEH
jgi:hypothetical protein